MAKKKGLKVIICGDRNCEDSTLLEQAIEASPFNDDIEMVISGGAKGADTLGEEWAKLNNIKVKIFEPKWNDITAEGAVIKEKINPWTKKVEQYNSLAGFKRNSDMVEIADAVIALQPNGPTNGTQDTIKKANKKKIPVFIYPPEEERVFEYQF